MHKIERLALVKGFQEGFPRKVTLWLEWEGCGGVSI